MPNRITKPGFYPDMSSAAYFADPCPSASLTQSVAKILLDRSPLHAWHAHPRLNPDYRHDDDTKFDVGNIAHKLMLGRGKEIVVLPAEYDDWRRAASRNLRDQYAAEGKLAVLGKHYAKADRMVRAAREQLELRGLENLFLSDAGESEVVVIVKDGDIWLRQMIDWLSNGRTIFADYKTTGESAAPHVLGRKMVNDGWPIQAAMAERLLDKLDPQNAGRRDYLFVVQEADPPYCLNVAEIGEGALTMGRKQLEHAVETWRECVESDRWPGYPAEVVNPEYPGWHEAQWLGREVEHAARRERIPSDLLAAG